MSTAARSSRPSRPGSGCPTPTSPAGARPGVPPRRPGRGPPDAGLPVIVPEATYFATVDVGGVQPDGDGLAFCRSLPERAGVVAVPTVVFYDPAHADLGRHLVRFAFCKRDEVLGEAVERWRLARRRDMRIAAVQHDIVWEDREANFERLAPKIARRGRRRRRVRAAHRDLLHRLLDDAGHRRARGRAVVAVPRRAGRRARGLGGRHLPGGRRRRGTTLPYNSLRPRRARRHGAPLPQAAPVHPRRRARALPGRARSR